MEIDFITAFGRLLRDGALRDTFATNARAAAEKIHLRQADVPAWLQLVPADVEFQAKVLLHKRLDLVRYFAPETSTRLAERLWKLFEVYGRVQWPPDGSPKLFDTFQFCQHLKQQSEETVALSEWNRLSFALSKHRVALHWVQILAANGKKHRGIQLFVRGRNQCWREFFFYLGL